MNETSDLFSGPEGLDEAACKGRKVTCPCNQCETGESQTDKVPLLANCPEKSSTWISWLGVKCSQCDSTRLVAMHTEFVPKRLEGSNFFIFRQHYDIPGFIGFIMMLVICNEI